VEETNLGAPDCQLTLTTGRIIRVFVVQCNRICDALPQKRLCVDAPGKHTLPTRFHPNQALGARHGPLQGPEADLQGA
jgi:hypothetical protein